MSISALGSGSSSSLAQLLQQAYQKANTDGQSGLSLTEFQAAAGTGRTQGPPPPPPGGKGPEEAFANMDADGDGAVSQDEFATAFSKLQSDTKGALLSAQEDQGPDASEVFAKLDANGDGSVSQDEFLAGGPQGPGGPHGAGGHHHGASADGGSEDDLTSLFDALDTDGDGTVSDNEIQSVIDSLNGNDSSQSDTSAAGSKAASLASQLYTALSGGAQASSGAGIFA